MYIYLLVLRILHIGCGIMWAGTALILVFYIFPAVERSGPDGRKILQVITGTNRFPQMITVVSSLTIITGFLLMWQLSSGFSAEWFSSEYGRSLAIGGSVSFIAFLQVVLINRPAILRTQTIGKSVAAKGGIPSEEEQRELLKIRKRVFLSTRWIAFWLIIAIVTMAGARYF